MTALDVDLDELRDREWMAKRINKSVDWIDHHIKELPHIRIGQTAHFTERLAREYIEAQTFRPASGQTKASQRASARRAA